MIKQQCRIDQDFHEEDEILTLYGNSAERQIIQDTRRSFEALKEMNEDDPTKIPDDIMHASLMLVDYAYEQRSPVDKMVWSVVPMTYEKLIKPYIRLSGI